MMTTENILTIASLAVGALGFLFGVYQHFSNRRVAHLSYEINQLTDYDLPEKFLKSVDLIPFSILVKNIGNKRAENVNIRLTTFADIENLVVESGEKLEQEGDSRKIQIRISSFNPGESLSLSAQCKKQVGLKTYVEDFSVTHSEGVGVDRKSIQLQAVSVSFLGIDFTYDFGNRRIRIS